MCASLLGLSQKVPFYLHPPESPQNGCRRLLTDDGVHNPASDRELHPAKGPLPAPGDGLSDCRLHEFDLVPDQGTADAPATSVLSHLCLLQMLGILTAVGSGRRD